MQPLKIRTWLDGHSPTLQAVSALTPWQMRGGGERGDVAARQVGLRDDIVRSAAREQHGVPRIHPMDLVALTQVNGAAGDEVEVRAALRGSEPKAEGRRKLNAPIFDASQTHADQKFIQRVEGRFRRDRDFGRAINHIGVCGIDRPNRLP